MCTRYEGRFGQHAELEGRWTTAERHDTPLLVCLHGGNYDNRYYDAPRHSLLAAASAMGFSAIALTRPGYPADAMSVRQQPPFATTAVIISDVITDVWNQIGGARPGVVLAGHSIGAAISTHIAAGTTRWPLLGLALSGVGDTLAAGTIERFRQLPTDAVVALPPEVARPLVYGPDWTLDTEALTDLACLGVTSPSAELVEITNTWLDDLPRIARRINVPLHYALGEYDGLWAASSQRIGAFAAHFTAAPFVDAGLWRCAGHNIEHHRLGLAYVRDLLSFAERCAMEVHRP